MEYTMETRTKKIVDMCLQQKSKNPIEIFHNIADTDCIRIHGPEHHILDGAALLTAFYNAGGAIDLMQSLEVLVRRGLQMPGAICGQWGVCGAVSSMGAALAIIDGPRCCKRDAFLSFQEAIDFINNNYDVKLEKSHVKCGFSSENQQCIKNNCPFYKKKIAFICVHNSCRSQIAEALGKLYLSDEFECYSAGTETKPQINQDAVRIMKELYDIDMEITQYSKLITDIPNPDIAISMGCNVECPFIGRAFDDNWGLDDLIGKSDEEFTPVL